MHICQFYQGKQDLVNTLVPYFKAGLENNEYCIWITSEPLGDSEARAELSREVPDLYRYENSRQIEIIPYTEWYIKDGVFDASEVTEHVTERLETALRRNYAGIRLSGNASWLDKRDWKEFIEYERQADAKTSDYPGLAICAYPLKFLGVNQALDVIDHHRLSVIRRGVQWLQINKTGFELEENENTSAYQQYDTPVPVLIIEPDTRIIYANPSFQSLTGFSLSELFGQKPPYPWWADKTLSLYNQLFTKRLRKKVKGYEIPIRRKDGEQLWVEINSEPVEHQGRLTYYLSNWLDITGYKQRQQHTETYALQVTKTREAELKKIAEKLHEDVAQSLAALRLMIEAIIGDREPLSVKTKNRLYEIRYRLADILKDVSYLSYELRPGDLDILGWRASCELLIAELNEKGIHSEMAIKGIERYLRPEISILLFRIVQEIFKNIVKHAQSTSVAVMVHFYPGKVEITINDNGKGFESGNLADFPSQGKFGLLSIKEQIRLWGGSFSVRSQSNRGTRVKIMLKA